LKKYIEKIAFKNNEIVNIGYYIKERQKTI